MVKYKEINDLNSHFYSLIIYLKKTINLDKKLSSLSRFYSDPLF